MGTLLNLKIRTSDAVSRTRNKTWSISFTESFGEKERIAISEKVDTICGNRAHLKAVCYCWGWVLVILPDRYPLAGYLAQLRSGPEGNIVFGDIGELPTADTSRVSTMICEEFPFPNDPVEKCKWVSFFWVQSKGILDEIGERAGGWLQSIARELSTSNPMTKWVYLADAPPQSLIDQVLPHNDTWYSDWQRQHRGPGWHTPEIPASIDLTPISLTRYAPARDNVAILRDYLRRHPTDARGWSLLAYQFCHMDRNWRAAIAARRALQLAPEWIYPRLQLGYATMFSVKLESSVREFEAALDLAPLNIIAMMLLDDCYACLHKTEEVLHIKQELVRLDPGDFLLLEELGLFYHLKLGDFRKAEDTYLSVLKLTPHNERALYYLALIKLRQNHLDSARALCTSACRLIRSARNLDLMGSIEMLEGDLAEAISCFNEALRKDPGHESAYNHLQMAKARQRAQAEA